MTNSLLTGNVAAAITNFRNDSVAGYRQAFFCVGTTNLISDIGQIGALTPDFIKNDTAEYYFKQTTNGQLFLSPLNL